jgi:hypothetical protein
MTHWLRELVRIVRCIRRHKGEWVHNGPHHYCPVCDEGWEDKL